MGDGRPYNYPWATTPLRARVTLTILLCLLIIQLAGMISDSTSIIADTADANARTGGAASPITSPLLVPNRTVAQTLPRRQPVMVSGVQGEGCQCPSSCVDVECFGTQDFDINHVDLFPVRYTRCRKCVISNGACVSRQAASNCGASVMTISEKVLQCNQHKTIGRGFTLVRDEVSRLVVPCAAERVDLCKKRNREALLEFTILKNALSFIVENSEAEGVIQFVDFGIPDVPLAARMQSVANTDPAGKQPSPAVFVFAMKSPGRQFVSLTECLNAGDAKTRAKSVPMQIIEGNSFDKTVNDVAGILGSVTPMGRVLRVRAPGYEQAMVTVFDSIFRSEKPPALVISHTPAGAQTKLFGEWMLNMNYIGFQPSRCLSLTDSGGFAQLPSSDRRNTLESTLVWVPSTAQNAFRPVCHSACVRTQCIEGWRTQYSPCRPDDLCVMSPGHGCTWEVANTPCSQDVNWKTVLDCAVPDLPVPTFSMCFSMDLLLACRGANGCHGVNSKRGAKLSRMLIESSHALNTEGRAKMTLIDVGSFVGVLPVQFAKTYNGAIHVIEAAPTFRQLIHISKCFHGTTNLVVEEWGAGEVEEKCSVVPSTGDTDAGATIIACPSDKKKPALEPEAEDPSFKQIFRPLDSLLHQLRAAAAVEDRSTDLTARRHFVFCIDVNDRAASVLRGAKQWLMDPLWKPKYIILVMDAINMDTADEEMGEESIYETLTESGYYGSITDSVHTSKSKITSAADIRDGRLASKDHIMLFVCNE